MANRRQFIKTGALAAAFLAARKVFADGKDNTLLSGASPGTIKKPVLLSTWHFGVPANNEAWKVLTAGGRALDAVEAGVQIPEGDPNVRSVGYGGLPDRDGHVTLDSCIMDEKGNCGSVAFLENIKHPIAVARRVMEKTPHIMLVGEGAFQFAIREGFTKENLLTPEAEQAWKEWLQKSNYTPDLNVHHDTIGMIAIDQDGNLSGAVTTSGLAYKMHGRVGDSPIIGAALYVDNEIGAATATGVGEEVIRIVGAHTIVELMRQGHSPQVACEKAIDRIVKLRGEKVKDIQVGFLALNKQGETGAFSLNKGFQYAYTSPEAPTELKNSISLY
jgi:N4-(beta-N-acetylglucosaminyl)-L-asparaginase